MNFLTCFQLIRAIMLRFIEGKVVVTSAQPPTYGQACTLSSWYNSPALYDVKFGHSRGPEKHAQTGKDDDNWIEKRQRKATFRSTRTVYKKFVHQCQAIVTVRLDRNSNSSGANIREISATSSDSRMAHCLAPGREHLARVVSCGRSSENFSRRAPVRFGSVKTIHAAWFAKLLRHLLQTHLLVT